MSEEPNELENTVADHRTRRGWSQQEVASRAGLSRAGVSAIETGRLVPSTAAALALAAAFECRVEDLFRIRQRRDDDVRWAWPFERDPCRFWRAEVGGKTWLYPVEASPLKLIPHDGIYRHGILQHSNHREPSDTLVLASCDPAAGLLADELLRTAGVRLIVIARSSRAGLTLLEQGLVHAAGVHLSHGRNPDGNALAVRATLGDGCEYVLLRMARWEEGIALASNVQLKSIKAAMGANLRWIGREEGSGARQCLDELLEGRRSPRRLARDHRGVAEAVRCGWADAGVCLRLTGEEAGLHFLGVRQEYYDFCFRRSLTDDRRIRALIGVSRSLSFGRLLSELPGYDASEAGEMVEFK
jgi:molybdate-binding protein/transcriptional regulator with XRE-family HTH domain